MAIESENQRLDRLQRALPGLLDSVQIEQHQPPTKLAGDASTRAYYRIATNRRTFLAMVLPAGEASSKAEEITKTDRPITELPFIDVQRYLEYQRVTVPTIYGYDENLGVLLLEDFGDQILIDAVKSASESEVKELFMTALDQMERIALIPDTIDPSKCILFARRFDADLYNWEFMHFVEYALDKRITNPIGSKDRAAIVSQLTKLTTEYLSWGDVVSHRDFHARNLIVLESSFGPKRLGVIDFQDALLAPLFYDLASFLRDSYFTLPDKLQGELIENYRLRMKERNYNRTDSFDSFRKAFDLMGIHRNLKAAGRFFYIDEVKKNPNYIPHIPGALAYVMKDLERYEELKSLKGSLLPLLEELCEICQ